MINNICEPMYSLQFSWGPISYPITIYPYFIAPMIIYTTFVQNKTEEL